MSLGDRRARRGIQAAQVILAVTILAGAGAAVTFAPADNAPRHRARREPRRTAAPRDAQTSSGGHNSIRARALYAAMQREFFDDRQGLYVERTSASGARHHSFLWPYSQATAATLAATAVRGGPSVREVTARARGFERYWDPVGQPPAYAFRVQTKHTAPEHRYYDDQGWVGLDLLRAYTLTHDPRFLNRAQDVFAYLLGGWQRDPRNGCPGGILWKEPPSDDTRNAVSTLPAAEIAVRLYLITHNTRDLRWAKTMERWTRRCLGRRDGLVADHIDRTGKVDPTAWSYNQANALRVATLLARATRQRAPRRRALRLARVGLRELTTARLSREPPIFAAIWWSSLIGQPLPRPLHRRVVRDAQHWADARWDRRDPRRGILWTHRTRPPRLIDQAALAQIYAALATDGGRWWRP